MKKYPVITALDIGTTKICAIIAAVNPDNVLEVKGVGISESNGLEKGIVKDINKTSESIRLAIQAAENKADLKAENIFAGIAGEHIKSRNAIGRISISDPSGKDPLEISEDHINAVINDAKRTVKIQQGHENLEIIHGIPQYYDIDNQRGIINPINMSGYHLTAHVHIVLADLNAIRNITKCIELAGFQPLDVVLEPIASAQAVLNEDELNLGCILIDIGGGTTDIAVFYKGSIRFSTVKPIGGTNVTQDLSIGLRTPPKSAEKLKVKVGNAVPATVPDEDTIEIEGIGGREPGFKKLKFISEIVESRMREILEISYRSVFANYNQELMTAGLILTGGASLLQNSDKLAGEVFNMPVKIGIPMVHKLKGPVSQLESPKFATSVGLLFYGLESIPKSKILSTHKVHSFNDRIIRTIKKWFNSFKDFI